MYFAPPPRGATRSDGARGKKQVGRPHVRTCGLSEANALYWQSTCDIVGTFRRPGNWAPFAPPLLRPSLPQNLKTWLRARGMKKHARQGPRQAFTLSFETWLVLNPSTVTTACDWRFHQRARNNRLLCPERSIAPFLQLCMRCVGKLDCCVARPVATGGIRRQCPQIFLCPENFVLTYNKNKSFPP